MKVGVLQRVNDQSTSLQWPRRLAYVLIVVTGRASSAGCPEKGQLDQFENYSMLQYILTVYVVDLLISKPSTMKRVKCHK